MTEKRLNNDQIQILRNVAREKGYLTDISIARKLFGTGYGTNERGIQSYFSQILKSKSSISRKMAKKLYEILGNDERINFLFDTNKSNLYHLLFEEFADGKLFKNQSNLVGEIYALNKEVYPSKFSITGDVNQTLIRHRKCSPKLRSAIEKVILNNLTVVNLSEEEVKSLMDTAIKKDEEIISTSKNPFGDLSVEQSKEKIDTEQALNSLYQNYLSKIRDYYAEHTDDKSRLGLLSGLEELVSRLERK